MTVAVSWLFYYGSRIRSKKSDEMTPSSFPIMLQNVGELPTACQWKPGRPESLLHETPATTERKNAPFAEGQAVAEEEHPQPKACSRVGDGATHRETRCRTAVSYENRVMGYGPRPFPSIPLLEARGQSPD